MKKPKNAMSAESTKNPDDISQSRKIFLIKKKAVLAFQPLELGQTETRTPTLNANFSFQDKISDASTPSDFCVCPSGKN